MSARISAIYAKVALMTLEIEGPLPTPCWVWQGGHSGAGRGGGYPRMSLDGGTVAVHRVMWTQVHGYIPPKKQIDHRCENRLCVNPAHLQMVTHKRNQKLKSEKRTTEVDTPIFDQETLDHFRG
tara:strand:+ start:5797 stop:6168 length:372 start_codon:yes stop_codon:yes gene_type:complete